MRATDGQQTVEQPSHRSPQLARCGADLATCRDDLPRRRDDLTARRDDRAALIKAAWRDVEVTVPSAEARRRHRGGHRAIRSTRAGRMLKATLPHARLTVPSVERSAPRAEATCSRDEAIGPHTSPAFRGGETSVPRAEAIVSSCVRDVSRCRAHQSTLANPLVRLQSGSFSPPRRLGRTPMRAVAPWSSHIRPLSQPLAAAPASWSAARDGGWACATHRSMCTSQSARAPRASHCLVDPTLRVDERSIPRAQPTALAA